MVQPLMVLSEISVARTGREQTSQKPSWETQFAIGFERELNTEFPVLRAGVFFPHQPWTAPLSYILANLWIYALVGSK